MPLIHLNDPGVNCPLDTLLIFGTIFHISYFLPSKRRRKISLIRLRLKYSPYDKHPNFYEIYPKVSTRWYHVGSTTTAKEPVRSSTVIRRGVTEASLRTVTGLLIESTVLQDCGTILQLIDVITLPTSSAVVSVICQLQFHDVYAMVIKLIWEVLK